MTDGNDTVPFFLLPDLGGSDLRGYPTYRFRDRHSMIATAEYRWYAQEFLDGAIFYDAGKTVSRREDLDFQRLKSSYGAGIRLHGSTMTVVRLEVARSREGTRFIIAFSPVGG
jgi:Omp85 superfamily domain